MSEKPAIGFCGLGAMGFGMATHLVKQGYPVTGFDVYAPTLERFAKAGGEPATTLAASASGKDWYICMVATAQQAQSALFDSPDAIVKSLPQGATLLLTSTVPASYAQEVEKQLKGLGREDIHFIDCPVSGGAIRAADGTLSIMAGAKQAALDKGKWLLEELTAPGKLFVVPGGVGGGSNLKMVHQVLASIQILSTSEAFGFGARLGLNAADVRKAVVESKGWSWMFENRSGRTVTEDYYPGASALGIIMKDTSIITAMARHTSFPTTLVSVAEQVYTIGHNLGYTPHDDAGVVRVYFPDAVSSVQSNLSEEEKSAKLKAVVDLLIGVHLVAAAESIAFAKHVGLDLQQLYDLAVEAAGGSTQFKEEGKAIIDVLEGRQAQGENKLADVVKGLDYALEEAYKVRCSLFLGSAAFNVGLSALKRGAVSAAEVVTVWK